MAARRLDSLSIDDIQRLMGSLNMNNYKESFLINEIDGQTLDAIESPGELVELGVTIQAKANLLFKRICSYREEGVPLALLLHGSNGASANGGSDGTVFVVSSLKESPLKELRSSAMTGKSMGASPPAAGGSPGSQSSHIPVPIRSSPSASGLDTKTASPVRESSLATLNNNSLQPISKGSIPGRQSSSMGRGSEARRRALATEVEVDDISLQYSPISSPSSSRDSSPLPYAHLAAAIPIESDRLNKDVLRSTTSHTNSSGNRSNVGMTKGSQDTTSKKMVSPASKDSKRLASLPNSIPDPPPQQQTSAQLHPPNQAPTTPPRGSQSLSSSSHVISAEVEPKPLDKDVASPDSKEFGFVVNDISATHFLSSVLADSTGSGILDFSSSGVVGDDDMSVSVAMDFSEFDILGELAAPGQRSPSNSSPMRRRAGRSSTYHRSWLHQLKAHMHSAEFVIKMLSSLRYLLLHAPATSISSAVDSGSLAGNNVNSSPQAMYALVQELFMNPSLCDTVSEIIKIHSAYAASSDLMEVPTSTLLLSPTNSLALRMGIGSDNGKFTSLQALELALVFLTNCLLALGPVDNTALCNVIVSVLEDHEMIHDVISPALLLLALMGRNDENTSHLASLEICPLLSTLCARYADSLAVLESGLLTISSLCDVESQRILLAGSDVGMCSVILSGLSNHWQNINIASASLQCINKLCYDSIYSIDTEDELELCMIIVRIVEYHYQMGPELPSVAMRAMEILSGSFSTHSSIQSENFQTANIDAFTHAGMCHAVCAIVREYGTIEHLAIAACRLMLIASMYSVNSRSMLFDADVCRLLADVLTNTEYLTNESVIKISFRCVNSLLTANSTALLEKSTRPLTLVYKSVLRSNAKNELLILLGLQNVALLGEVSIVNKLLLCASGTIQSLVRFMHLHATNQDIIEAAYFAIASTMKDAPAQLPTNFAATYLNNSASISNQFDLTLPPGTSSGVHNSSASVVTGTGGDDGSVFGSGAADPRAAANTRSANATSGASGSASLSLTTAECHELIHLLRTYSWHLGVISTGLNAMRYLMHHPAIKGALIRHGVAVAVVEALKKHTEDVFVATTGLWVINAMAYKSTSNNFSSANVALKNAGVHPVVVMILQTHILDPEVAEAGLRAISVLGANSVCRAALAQAGACAVVLQVMSKHILPQTNTSHTGPESIGWNSGISDGYSTSGNNSAGSTPMIARYACAALFYLAYGNTANAVQIKLMGGKTLLKELIINNPGVTDEWAKGKAKDVHLMLSKAV